MTGDHDITGRDGYLIIDALAMAITVLEQLQSKDRPTTDIDDSASCCARGVVIATLSSFFRKQDAS